MRRMAAILSCEFFGRSLSTPVILKSRLMPREMTVNVRPTTWSVPKRLDRLGLRHAPPSAPRSSVVPATSGKLTTFRKSSSTNR